jgi:hypothetical protein
VNIGGIYDTVGIYPGGPVPGSIQSRALDFLNREVFVTPRWLINKDVLLKVNRADSSVVSNLQLSVIEDIFSPKVFVRLLEAQKYPALKISAIGDYLITAQKYIFCELDKNKPIDRFRQSMQTQYVKTLIIAARPFSRFSWPPGTTMDTYSAVTSIVKSNLNVLRNQIDQSTLQNMDQKTILHLRKLKGILETVIN